MCWAGQKKFIQTSTQPLQYCAPGAKTAGPFATRYILIGLGQICGEVKLDVPRESEGAGGAEAAEGGEGGEGAEGAQGI